MSDMLLLHFHPSILVTVHVQSSRFGSKGACVDIPCAPCDLVHGLVSKAIDEAKYEVLRQLVPPRSDAHDDMLHELNARLIAHKFRNLEQKNVPPAKEGEPK